MEFNRIFSLITLCFVLAGSANAQNPDTTSFYNINRIQEITIKFKEDNWRYLLDSLRFNGDGMVVADTVAVNGKLFFKAGVRILDDHTFQPGGNRNSLYVKLNYENTDQSIEGHHALELSSALRDPSMVREVLGFEMARKYFPAPRANYAKVQINQEYYGLFVNLEPIEGDFLARHFGTASGVLYHSHPQPDKKTLDGCAGDIYGSLQPDRSQSCLASYFQLLQGGNYQELSKLIKTLNESPTQIEPILNVDLTLWMLAFNNLFVNLASYSGRNSPKYFLYQDANGRFSPILCELNLIFGGYKNTGKGSDLKLEQLIQLDPLLHADNPSKPLISNLLKNPYYKKLYLSHLRTLLYNELISGAYETRAKELQALIRTAFINDRNKTYTSTDFDNSLSSTIGKLSKIPGITEILATRAQYLKKHPELIVIPPSLTNLKLKTREKYSPSMVTDFQIQVQTGQFARRIRIFYRFDDQEPFQEMSMSDDGQHFDEQANDSIFGAIIQPGSGKRSIEYYLVAENARLVTFSPDQYLFVRHHANLDDLNK